MKLKNQRKQERLGDVLFSGVGEWQLSIKESSGFGVCGYSTSTRICVKVHRKKISQHFTVIHHVMVL